MKGSNGNNDQGHMLLLFGMIVLFALCPPVATVIVLCIAFSDGTVPGVIRADKTGDTARTSIENIELRKNPLGYPEPPAFLKDVSLIKATKQLLSFDIPAIKKAQRNGQFTEADQLTRTLCSDFRKVVEQGIGQDLLSGIVSRFGREIFSLKLPRLYAMTQEDITLFDDMMTKYSYQEHSQPVEAPINLPDIADIEADVKKMQDWAKAYSNRCENAVKKARGKNLAAK